ncbi:MAG: hypothetical protein PHY02_08655 [Phycisphaerae bacterium]|nr:hypothetical protein [Phycisphaerae bacterium]
MSVPGRMKHLESVISVCLLAVLVLIGIGIFVKQSDYDVTRYGVPPSPGSGETSQQQDGAGQSAIGAGLAPAGFEELSKAKSYNSDNLYEKINGKAPLYTESGFKELFTQRFISTSDPNLWIEFYAYDMGGVKNAFSVYSVQKRAESQPYPSIQIAYKTSNALYFVHGRYYIELVGSAESDELFKAVTEIAGNIQANLAVDKDADMAEFAMFPRENQVADSIKFYLENAFGCEKLTNTFSARYKIGNETITAFLSKRADSKEAEAVSEGYLKFLIENGAKIKDTTNKTIAGRVVDFYGATEIVFAVGPFVAGIHEAQSQASAEKLAEELINKLKSINNE